MNKLSKSMGNYIKAVYELSSGSGDGAVRVIDIADRLGVSKASASLAMSKLVNGRMVRKDERRHIYLTPQGERHAVLMMDKCMVIQNFLTEILAVDNKIAQADACAIEHVVSLDTLCSLCRFVSRTDAKLRCKGGCHVQRQDSSKA